ncbi:hypothetical protein [Streptomyces atriruber]|uniref:hypothetical protein n=1 Tax=Streptomyces atriruber TaxID=545121 RepID=UPI0006E3AD0B|nr:hypothetical protein [Streptomyces atriruber]
MAGRIYVSRVSGVVQLEDGSQITLQEGVTRVREGHALLEDREDLFQEIGVHYEVEAAVARPEVPAKRTEAPVGPAVKRGPGRPSGKQGA